VVIRRVFGHHGVVNVLIVEDDDAIAATLSDGLEGAGHQAFVATTGRAAIEAHAAQRFDVILLDLGLPDLDGRDVFRELRAVRDVPVIMVTARSEEFDRVLGLELGADDYITKPFSLRELLARIRAVTRRLPADDSASPDTFADGLENASIEVGPLHIDRRSHRVLLAGDELTITPKEFDLLVFLAEDPGAVRTRTDIVESVWDAHWYGPTKTVDAHVASLRKKLGDHRWIVSVRGVGFRLEAPE
jgi:DNA-binding response OmpR family regulator